MCVADHNIVSTPVLNLKTRASNSGFTLVELLVVIAIIGVLATLVLLQLGVARAKARDTKRVADVNQLRSASELYFDDNSGKYETDLTIANLGKYLSTPAMPQDPVQARPYFLSYNTVASPIQYQVWAELENKNANALAGDSDINSSAWTKGAASAYGPIDASVAGAEACSVAYSATAQDCIFDLGQK